MANDDFPKNKKTLSVITEGATQVVRGVSHLDQGEVLESEFAAPEGAESAVILVETLWGRTELTMDTRGFSKQDMEELARYEQVCLRVVRIGHNAKTIALKIQAVTKSVVRITVAFVTREAKSFRKNFSCRMCKQLVRLAVCALFAHFGVPYLSAEASDVPVPINEDALGFLDNPMKGPAWLRELFESIDPKTIAAVRGALEFVDKLFKATDRIYTAVCEKLQMCQLGAT